ncbi:putative ribonuclease H-like domain-containing protein [Rosa chinensis]|uniref:Putative ribonuclease H-like domain-containing protein n=1 Tax=Rosa chinensis TaxID=74649 RepID=A0A2P6QS82_ROSCH|nr:putative ribonuclease H-like domain-containing protein [Rosa chinensis]
MLFLCKWVERVWFASTINYKPNIQTLTSFDRWITGLKYSNAFTTEQLNWILTQMAFLCWHIWKARCGALYEHKGEALPDPGLVASSASAAALEFLHVNKKGNQNHDETYMTARIRDQKWVPPQSDFIKLNVNGSWIKSSGEGGVGVVARNASGQLVGGVEKQTRPSKLNFRQFQKRFLWHLGKGGTKWKLNQTRETLNAIKGKKNSSWEVYPILRQIRQKEALLSQIRWCWVHREVNQAADCLASLARRRLCAEAWVNRPPSSLVFILSKDGLPCLPNVEIDMPMTE